MPIIDLTIVLTEQEKQVLNIILPKIRQQFRIAKMINELLQNLPPDMEFLRNKIIFIREHSPMLNKLLKLMEE